MTSQENPSGAVIGRAGSYGKGVARRQEILDRAIETFRERGAAGTSLRSIAQSIGISHAALLHYFDSREQLLVAVYARAESQRDTGGDSAESALDVLVQAAMINVGVPGMVELYTTLVATSLAVEGSPTNEFFTDRFARIRQELTERLADEQAAGRVRDDVEPADMAALIIAASDGLQIQWLLEPSVELERTLETFSVLLSPTA
ncbi:TetR/AcrR family transcriptional regulator [Brachybacterium saurashtrense]|uniref:TetR/AcrR family transcriptional regulator n=1 Tax=Brachybacterium saurashtrense TaxID=556288 RepID=A0A345YMV3_9MICO|nr:TetR/AcrR family transcriptional regulator [Brachybacterium saurashtrense]AXK45255.1 TetR/AcrR family transcriptional regulator [Brachybacterium saurashtrense]RRR21990.1 TetR/AcrR family transcriptional regulator [Brachybacterium saurashtrense]